MLVATVCVIFWAGKEYGEHTFSSGIFKSIPWRALKKMTHGYCSHSWLAEREATRGAPGSSYNVWILKKEGPLCGWPNPYKEEVIEVPTNEMEPGYGEYVRLRLRTKDDPEPPHWDEIGCFFFIERTHVCEAR